MPALKLAIGWAWIAFWIYWLVSAAVSKQSVPGGWRSRLAGVSAVGVIEERNLTATFPTAYPEYRSRTKMLIPFLL